MNAATALGMVEALRFSGITVPQEAIREGLKDAKWPGRIEVASERPLIILDGAHNRASARALAETVGKRFRFKDLFLILGISKDKDIPGIVEELEPIAKHIISTKSDVSERAEDPEVVSAFLKGKKAVIRPSLREALAEARAKASQDDAILITGSLFLVGDAKRILEGESKT